MAEIEPDHLVYVDRSKNVLKLAQGEFVAVANLEAVFAGRAAGATDLRLRQQRTALPAGGHRPDAGSAGAVRIGDTAALKAALNESLRETAREAELQTYEVPVEFLIETEPFSAANGLLSGVGKILRPRLKDHYGERLEQLYAQLAAARIDELRALRENRHQPFGLDSVTRAAQTVLGSTDVEVDPDDHFTDLGGDSLSALTFANLLRDIFGVDVPVGVIVGPDKRPASAGRIHSKAEPESGAKRPTFATVHGRGATWCAPTTSRSTSSSTPSHVAAAPGTAECHRRSEDGPADRRERLAQVGSSARMVGADGADGRHADHRRART